MRQILTYKDGSRAARVDKNYIKQEHFLYFLLRQCINTILSIIDMFFRFVSFRIVFMLKQSNIIYVFIVLCMYTN